MTLPMQCSSCFLPSRKFDFGSFESAKNDINFEEITCFSEKHIHHTSVMIQNLYQKHQCQIWYDPLTSLLEKEVHCCS